MMVDDEGKLEMPSTVVKEVASSYRADSMRRTRASQNPDFAAMVGDKMNRASMNQ